MKAINLIGRRFGRLVAVKDVGSVKNGKSRVRLWLCTCDCTRKAQKRSSQLLQGRARSCGCLRSEVCRAKVLLPPGESGFNALLGRYRASARKKRLPFTLSRAAFRKLTQEPCHYCGTSPAQVSQIPHGHGGYTHNGIDRIENHRGYTPKNSVSSCSDCNFFKGVRSATEFLAKIRAIAIHTEIAY